MSKSGLFAHFGSKEELQLKTLRAARRIFYEAAVRPALDVPEGIEQLAALVDADIAYLSGDAFDGGCLFISSAAEYDSRPGPIRDLVQETMVSWLDLLAEQADDRPRQRRAHGRHGSARPGVGAARVRPRAQLGSPAQRLRRCARARAVGLAGSLARRGDRQGPPPARHVAPDAGGWEDVTR